MILLNLVRDYVEGIKDVPELLDMLAAPKDVDADKDKIIYDEVCNSSCQNIDKHGSDTLFPHCSTCRNL